MINKFALNVSIKLKSKYPSELPELDVLEYAIKFILTNIIPILIILSYGAITDNISNILLSLGSFSLLRMFSGGYHITSPELCITTSVALIILISEFSYLFEDYILFMNIVSFILVAIYSPSNIRSQTLLPEKYDTLFKLISCIIIIINIYINNAYISSALFAQSVLLIRLKGGE